MSRAVGVRAGGAGEPSSRRPPALQDLPLTYMQRSPIPNAFWEIALTNGTYSVRVVAGDPSFYDNQIAISAEGVVIVSGVTTSTQRWLDSGPQTVTAGDGRLTIESAAGANNGGNKICFIEITPM